MHSIHSPAYSTYLRRGASIKTAATHYIWRTQSDNRVRSSHAANNGKIFAWNNPPETGHPGEDYNCRCVAEPYTGIIPPEIMQYIRNDLLDYLASTAPWGNLEMSLYFFIGNGEPITLDAMGHADVIQDYYEQHYLHRFESQILSHAANAPAGAFEDKFEASYNFRDVLYSYRDSTIIGKFKGEITEYPGGIRVISGQMSFIFEDQFKDPLSVAQSYVLLRNFTPYLDDIAEVDLNAWFREATNLWQKPYPITGGWDMDYEAITP